MYSTYVLRCEPPDGCGWWWEVTEGRLHWWSRVTRIYRGPFWPGPDVTGGYGPGRLMSQDEFDDYGDCVPYLQRHDLAEGMRWRGVIPA